MEAPDFGSHMPDIKIVRATINDAEELTELAAGTYWDTFHDHPKNDPKDFAEYMENAFSLEQIKGELKNENSVFLIAKEKTEMAGYAKLEILSTEPPIEGINPIELNRLYATKKFIGKGVGQRLMDECLKTAEDLGCDVMWLGVWELNPRAIGFYKKNGFYEIGTHVFQMGSDRQTDLLMQRRVSS